ncbi:Uncharacterised protein [Mycobacteroides abscessus subsp. abscessus]|uniref:hypothetical protein n=1 Tax=Mycobacteroides abscessus TaxID=36809 RepID=UPI00092BEAAB|nr:hypothetical protein [Mycobacteroides abscessus]SIL60373.1 Uncharacterised protein [Mycobacteroides abscessus subsp. abscessus]
MDAKRAIREVIEEIPHFFGLTVRKTIGAEGETETRTYTQAQIAAHVASTLVDKLSTKGCLVVELPTVDTDEYGSRTVRVPITGQGWAYGEVRIDERHDRLAIVDIPSRLPIDSAPLVAAALLATHAASRAYQSPWGE